MLISPRDIKTSVTVSNSLIPEYKLPDDHVQCGFIVDAWSLNEISKCPILFCLSVLSWTCESRHDPLPPPFIQRLHHSRSKLRKVIVCHLPSACWFFSTGRVTRSAGFGVIWWPVQRCLHAKESWILRWWWWRKLLTSYYGFRIQCLMKPLKGFSVISKG